MEERGFDQLQTGYGPAALIISTILLVLLIIGGGLFMQRMERRWREEHAGEEREP